MTRDDFERFLEAYEDKYSNRYREVAKGVSKRLSKALDEMNLKHIASFREKELGSLRKKLYANTELLAPSQTDQTIIEAIKDLAGARVALYFPSDYVIVESKIFKLFKEVEIVEHPDLSRFRSSQQRFQGYFARHYIVNSEETLEVSNNSSLDVRVEIQVASLFMHAWAEVDHDLAYKPGELPLEYDERAILDSLNGLVLAAEVQLNSLKQKLANRGILKEPPRQVPPEISGELLRSTEKKLIIIGQNLYGLLVEDPNFEERLFKTLKEKPDLEVRVVVADPGSPGAEKDLSYGFPDFFTHLEKSILVLKRYAQKAETLGLRDRLKVGKSEEVKRETLFISDLSDDMKEGRISLRYTLLGTRPEDRPEIVIESQRHRKRFEELVENYKGLINWDCVRPLYGSKELILNPAAWGSDSKGTLNDAELFSFVNSASLPNLSKRKEGFKMEKSKMADSILGIIIRDTEHPCAPYQGTDHTFFIQIFHCDGTPLFWNSFDYGKPFRLDVQGKEKGCVHAQVKVPPGCYLVRGLAPVKNVITDWAWVNVGCDEAVCVNLVPPSVIHCINRVVAGLKFGTIWDKTKVKAEYPPEVKAAIKALEEIAGKLPEDRQFPALPGEGDIKDIEKVAGEQKDK